MPNTNIQKGVAILATLPNERIVQMMDETEDDVWDTPKRVADLFFDTLTPPPWYVDASSRHPHTGRPYYGPGEDDLGEMYQILQWLHGKGITEPAELLLGPMGWDAEKVIAYWTAAESEESAPK
jgi:hypothetical protein